MMSLYSGDNIPKSPKETDKTFSLLTQKSSIEHTDK